MVLFEGSWLSPQVQNLVARQSSDSPYLFYCINPYNNFRTLGGTGARGGREGGGRGE